MIWIHMISEKVRDGFRRKLAKVYRLQVTEMVLGKMKEGSFKLMSSR